MSVYAYGSERVSGEFSTVSLPRVVSVLNINAVCVFFNPPHSLQSSSEQQVLIDFLHFV